MDPAVVKAFVDSLFAEALVLEGTTHPVLQSVTNIAKNVIDTFLVGALANIQQKNPTMLLQLKSELEKFNIQYCKMQQEAAANVTPAPKK